MIFMCAILLFFVLQIYMYVFTKYDYYDFCRSSLVVKKISSMYLEK